MPKSPASQTVVLACAKNAGFGGVGAHERGVGGLCMRCGAPFSLSSSARNKPYMWEHLRITLYALVTTAGALL